MRVNVTRGLLGALVPAAMMLGTSTLLAQPELPGAHQAGEANLVLPDLSTVPFLGTDGHTLLLGGLIICALGLVFGLTIYTQLKHLPVHASMLEISELIYETCKTYLLQQGKFLLILEVFIGVIIAFYFGVLQHFAAFKVVIILLFSLIGIAGSYGVAWFGIRVNTFANSRTAFASLRGKPYPCYAIPLKAGMSIGMMLISVELLLMLVHPAVHPGRLRRPLLHRLRHRRIARRGGTAHRGRHLHEDRRHRRGPDEDRLQDQGRRRAQPGRDRGLHRRQRGRLGRALGRRLRDLRRHRRGADFVHPAGGDGPDGPGSAAGLDLRDAHHDGRGVSGSPTSSTKPSPRRSTPRPTR